MKTQLLNFCFRILLLFTAPITSFSQNIEIKQSNESGVYKMGELIRIVVSVKDSENETLSVTMRKNYSAESQHQKLIYTGKSTVLFSGSFTEPTSLIFEIRSKDEFAATGLVVAPELFQPGTCRPKDFDKYWNNERKQLRKLQMEIKSETVKDIDDGFTCSDIEINCTEPKPVRGYFAKPLTAEPKSLPIVLFVRAAGVKGEWCQSKPKDALYYAKMGKGTLAFDLNAHGMLNGQPQEYYDELEKEELKNYWEIGMEDRNEFYFRGMYLRLMRALDFLCKQPEWDGKRILVVGESQGGGQALAAAGLDERVTAVVATVPAMCDFGGELIGRKGGWPNPFAYKKDIKKMQTTLPYFDTAHLLKNSNAILVTEIGFIDTTCPSVSIYAAINQASGQKIIYGVPYRGHHVDQKQFQKIWEQTVYQPKMKFIEDFLK